MVGFIGAIDSRSAEQVRVGKAGRGDRQAHLRSDTRLGELPASIAYGNTHGVVEDSQHNIYIHHTVNRASESSDTMVVFDEKGKFVRSWGKAFRGVAHGLLIRKEGSTEFLYLTLTASNPRMTPQPDMQAMVLKATLRGEIVWKIQGPPDIDAYNSAADGTPKKYSPTNVAVAPNGDIYVADGYGSSYVSQYNANGEYMRTFGGRGSDPGQLAEPHGIWMDMRTGKPILTVAAIHTRRQAYRLHHRRDASVPLRRIQRRRGDSGPAGEKSRCSTRTTR
jgi:hypothetical protein